MAPDLVPEAVTEAEEETERFGHRGEVVRTGNNKNPLVKWILKQDILEGSCLCRGGTEVYILVTCGVRHRCKT